MGSSINSTRTRNGENPSQIPSLLVEKYGRLVGGQRVQEDRLHRMPLGRRQVVHKRVQQQRSDAIASMRTMDAQREYVANVGGTAHRVRQDALVLHWKTAQPGVQLITITHIGYYLLVDISIGFDFGND